MIRAVLKDPLEGANGLERKYGERLQLLKRAGEIEDWGFHRLRLRLADGTWYTPDFDVTSKSREWEIHETKGGFMREAARVRYNVAASCFPFRFFVVKLEAGTFTFHEGPI